MAVLQCNFPHDGHQFGDYMFDVPEHKAAELTQLDFILRVSRWVRVPDPRPGKAQEDAAAKLRFEAEQAAEEARKKALEAEQALAEAEATQAKEAAEAKALAEKAEAEAKKKAEAEAKKKADAEAKAK